MLQNARNLFIRLFLLLFSSIIYAYLKSLRIKVDESLFERCTGDGAKPVIFVCWHHSLLVGSLVVKKMTDRSCLLLSHSKSVDFLDSVLKKLGHATIRGSSHKGGKEAMVQLVREVRNGCTVAITPDGSKGPACKFKPGALVLAQKFDIPLVIIRANYSFHMRLNTWDRLYLPLPFSRIAIDLESVYFKDLISNIDEGEQSQLLETAAELMEAKMLG
jgi:lysophospholipid acyltransferase (LPLAT)-like uncharacterized protein